MRENRKKKKIKSARYGREQGEVRTRAADLGPAQVERSLVNASPPPPCDRTHSAEEEKKENFDECLYDVLLQRWPQVEKQDEGTWWAPFPRNVDE